MPYKSYKKSKNSKNSKSGGRRRKHTMRKYRRGKKVMRGGGGEYIFTNKELTDAYNSFVQGQGKNALDQLRTNVFPTLFTLTDVGQKTSIDRTYKVPEFWMKSRAFENALKEDTTLNIKISGNADLIKTLKLKTPQEKDDEAKAAEARKLFPASKLSQEEMDKQRMNNPYFNS